MGLIDLKTKEYIRLRRISHISGMMLLPLICFACISESDKLDFEDDVNGKRSIMNSDLLSIEEGCIGENCDADETSINTARIPANGSIDTLFQDESLATGQYIQSLNGKYRFYLQGDGNMVLRDWSTRKALWASATDGQGGRRLILQSDSNLVLYTDTNVPLWASHTRGAGVTKLKLNNDGSLVLYADKDLVWSVNMSKRKNVLFIISDDLTKTLSSYGHPVVRTPNIDRLTSQGIRFHHAYSNYSVCNPSRSSFLTGLKPQTLGVMDNTTPLQSVLGDRITLPYLFKKNGYHTTSLGKVFHSTREYNDMKAWDEIYDYGATNLGKQGEGRNITNGALGWCRWLAAEGDDEDQGDGQIARKAVEFIKSEHQKPFFLAVGLHKPHDPFVAPKKYFDMYPLAECDPPQLPRGWSRPNNFGVPSSSYGIFQQFTDRDKREFLRAYYACSSFMDAQIGKIMDALEESGQRDNTLIVLLGDHGYHLGEHNHWNKVTLYEKGTSAPFIVAGPMVGSQGVASDAMFEFIDIYPTLAELLELEGVPSYLEGRSFADVIRDPSLPFRDEVHAVIQRGSVLGKTVRNERWRYTEWDNGNKGRELYDQVNDPMEYNNLADNSRYSQIADEMRILLHRDY